MRLKALENGRVHVTIHLSDLKELFPENQLPSEEELLLRFCLYFHVFFRILKHLPSRSNFHLIN